MRNVGGVTYVKGGPVGPLGRPPRRYAAGRICVVEECETVLSVYNRSAFCWSHDPNGRVVGTRYLRRQDFFALSRT